jgi:uncharacterized protein (TIGR02996 family)
MNEAAFLESIVAEPDEDAHRLVFADWLDEHGDAAFAGFIRDQVELARLDEGDPQYPALLARSRRSGMLTDKRRRPMVDHVPGGQVLFRRGLIEGVRISGEAFLRHSSGRWSGVPLERLWLDDDVAPGVLPRRQELRRVRTLCYESPAGLFETEALLADCPHLANVRDLRLTWGQGADRLIDRLALPSLDSLAVHLGNAAEGWEAFVPRNGPNLRRIALTGEATDDGDWGWQSPSLDWLMRTRHGSTLEEAYLRRDVWHNPHGYPYTAAAPLHDPALLGKRLRRVEMDGASALRLLDVPDWGGLEHLAVRLGPLDEQALDGLLASPQARRLRSLLFEAADGSFEDYALPRLRQAARPGWRCLRVLDWAVDLLAACCERLLRLSVNDLASDLTFARQGLTFPELRFLLLDVDEAPGNLPRLIGGLKAPNLCTLVVLGVETLRSSTLRSLARLPGTPHLSLVGAGEQEAERWWVLGGGAARRVSAAVLPLETDWWDPLPDRPR